MGSGAPVSSLHRTGRTFLSHSRGHFPLPQSDHPLLATHHGLRSACSTKKGRKSSPSKFLSPDPTFMWHLGRVQSGFCIAAVLKLSTEDRNIKTQKKSDLQYGLEQQNCPLCSLVKYSKNKHICVQGRREIGFELN